MFKYELESMGVSREEFPCLWRDPAALIEHFDQARRSVLQRSGYKGALPGNKQAPNPSLGARRRERLGEAKRATEK
jgi:hypothetical protein